MTNVRYHSGMIRGFIAMIAAPAALLVTTQAQAELNLCNRTSFRIEAAVGIEKRANVMTRGWYRLDPGQCRQVMDGPLDADMVYLHARTPSVYGARRSRSRRSGGRASSVCIGSATTSRALSTW